MDWEVKKINDFAEFVGSGVTPKGGQSVYKTKGIPFVRSQNVYPDGLRLDNVAYIDEKQNDKMKRTEFKENDILLNITGASIGRCTYVPEGFGRGNVNQHVCIIRTNKTVSLKYISLYINSPFVQKQIEALNTGSSREGLNFQQVRRLNICLPKMDEQVAIENIIITIDVQIERTESLIEKTKELKKGLMQRLLTKGIGHTEFKETEVGIIPKAWRVNRIIDVADTASGGTPSRSKKEYYENGIIPWVKTGELGKKYIYDTEEKITQEAIKKSSAKLIPINSVLIAMYGATIGKTSITKNVVSTNQASCAVICKLSQLDYEYLYYISSFYKEKLIELGAGGAQPNISQQLIKEFKIPVPNIKEQKNISDILSTFDRKIEQYEIEKQKYQQLKQGLTQKLLIGKIRVKV
ncbi:restriction endonuclease subunit S [Clostridium sp.]|uniref:restriction endonuclease subunit S n=1 Tax=Clostridium sp. TaxID=1506 RepID=UPI001A51A2D2|nr:restriction endonuclease subunit S [Clostridium sp.]MBK5241940.1 restriction endonuclease subunit S [Clostridium sp.]